MFTLSLLWLVLAASVTLIAITRRAPDKVQQESCAPSRESGGALTVLAVIYGVVLLTGFVYVSRFLVSGF